MECRLKLASIIFLGFCKLILCENKCNKNTNDGICCSDYHFQQGKCVACPKGTYGANCSKKCPTNYHGDFCKSLCNCPEKQICNATHGCIGIQAISTTQFKTEIPSLSTTKLTPDMSTELTTAHTTEVQNSESMGKFISGSIFLYLVIPGCSSLFFLICLLVIYRNFRHTREEIKQNNQALPQTPTPPEPDREDSPHHVVFNVNADASGSDYAEIHECNHTYSTGAEVSSIYNILSFSRSKYISETFNSLSGIYGTSKSCSPQRNETTSIETKSDETDNAPLNPEDYVADTEKECGKDGASISQKGDE